MYFYTIPFGLICIIFQELWLTHIYTLYYYYLLCWFISHCDSRGVGGFNFNGNLEQGHLINPFSELKPSSQHGVAFTVSSVEVTNSVSK